MDRSKYNSLSPALLVLAWLAVSTVCFQHFEHWSLGQAFFFALDTGFCRLFGAVNPSSAVGSTLSIINQLLGTAAAAIVVEKYAERLLDRSRMGKPIGKAIKLDDDEEIRKFCSDIRTNGPFRSLAVDVTGDGIADAIGVDTTGNGIIDTVIRADVPPVFTRANTLLSAALMFWILLGVCYGMFVENWSLVTSLYFAMTTLGIGGLQPPATDAGGSIPEAHAFAVAVFVLVGVPLFTAVNGEFVAYFLEAGLRREAEARGVRPLDVCDLHAVSLMLDSDGKAGKAQYVLLELLRDGRTDAKAVAVMAQRFEGMDKDGDGLVCRAELLVNNEARNTDKT